MPVCPSCHSSYDTAVRLCPRDGTPLPIDPPPDPNLGQLLAGKYRIDAFINAGGMGAVYRATHVMLDRTVAIKLIRKELVQTPEAALRFQREARAASTLEHPNIAAVYDFGQTADGTLYITMEFVEGPSLKEIIRQDGPMASDRIVDILAPVAGALARAHRHRIIHRDLKPHNIMLATDKDGRQIPKLLDFGIAKTVGEDETALTMTGYALGTPQYMSPEQATGQAVDGRSDLYSLGVVLYEMLIGDVPFTDTSLAGVLLKQMTMAPDAPSRRRPDVTISPVLEAVALRCLEKEPDRRFQSAEEFITALTKPDTAVASAVVATTVRMPAAVVPVTGRSADESGRLDLPEHSGPPDTVPASSWPRRAPVTGATQPPRGAPGPTDPATPVDSPQPQPRTTASRVGIAHGQSEYRGEREPMAPPVVGTPSAGVVKPGTQPTVLVPGPAAGAATTPPRHGATRGPAFRTAAFVIVLAVIGSGAWVIRTWLPPGSPDKGATPPPTATPAMAQSTPPAEPASEQPAGAAAAPDRSVAMATSPASEKAVPRRDVAPVATSPGGSLPAPSPVAAANGSKAAPGSAAAPLRSASPPAAGFSPSASPSVAGAPPPPATVAASSDVLTPDASAAGAAASATRGQDRPAAAPVRAEHPSVWVECSGPLEICSAVRSAMADALRRQHMPTATARSRADVALAVDVEVIDERVERNFGTTFATRTYAVDVAGESLGVVVAMPPARTFSFDAQVGRERANENARLIAADAVGRVREFWNQQP